MKKRAAPIDPPAVTARATQIARETRTQYWLVATAYDLDALCRGRVTADVAKQAVALLQQAIGEGVGVS